MVRTISYFISQLVDARWEGMGDKPRACIDWRGQPWKPGKVSTPAAHPNSRFCSPLVNCPSLDPAWQDPEGVPITAILFGGRRPRGVPLVYQVSCILKMQQLRSDQAVSWEHGVFMGACVKSEATAAAEHKGKVVMHDPFSMRPFFGYNFGDYLRHWLDMGRKVSQVNIKAGTTLMCRAAVEQAARYLHGELVPARGERRPAVAGLRGQHPGVAVGAGPD